MADKYTESARGQECQVRIPGICSHDPETVVFAHLNGGGMGMKRASANAIVIWFYQTNGRFDT